MHPSCLAFLAEVKQAHPELFRSVRVVEFGSYDVNGTPRHLFADCEYVGVDWRAGPSVDVVSLFHEYVPSEPHDVAICVNTLEHDPYWAFSLPAMARSLKPGGALILNVDNQPPHEKHTSPIAGYCQAIEAAQLGPLLSGLFEVVDVRLAGNDLQVLCLERKP